MNEWNSLFATTAGASATLTSLLFVGVSINLSKIFELPSLPDCALISMIPLVTILIVSILALIPGQSFTSLEIRIIVLGIIIWIVMIIVDIKNRKAILGRYRHHFLLSVILDQLAVIAYIVSGIAIFRFHDNGLYWLVPAIIFSFIKVVMDALVLLVEINR